MHTAGAPNGSHKSRSCATTVQIKNNNWGAAVLLSGHEGTTGTPINECRMRAPNNQTYT